MPRKIIQWLILFLLAWMPVAGAAENSLVETPWPEALEPALAHLHKVSNPATGVAPDMEKLGPLLEFLLQAPEPEVLYQADELVDLPSAWYVFDMDTSLANVLKLSFNSNIPALLTAPSSVRLANWRKVDGKQTAFPDLGSKLDPLDEPVVVRAVEYEEITPDLFTGAYYSYELDRTIILFRYLDRTVLLTLSRQRDTSEVGRRGMVLDDDRWKYLYFEDRGLSLPGMGWVNSYIYDSFGISLFVTEKHGAPPLRVGLFKGLRAGWAGMNMVKNYHIHRGMERHATALREVLESGSLPNVETITTALNRISSLDDSALQEYVQTYYQNLRATDFDDLSSAAQRLLKQARKPEYVQSLTRQQLTAVLHLEYLKVMLGKSDYGTLEPLWSHLEAPTGLTAHSGQRVFQ